MSDPAPPARWVARAYAALLHVYPRRFRDRHGEEMLRVYLEGERDAATTRAVWRFRAGAAIDAVRNGVGERWTNARLASDGPKGGGMDGLIRDCRYALRSLARSPGFTAVAVLTLGLGIGANTAIFSVVHTVLLAPLPYQEPDELVLLWGELRNRGVLHFPSSPGDFNDYRQQADLLEDLAGVATFRQPLTGDGEPIQIDVGAVTTNFFDVLGVQPALGRGFIEEDGAVGDPEAAPGEPGFLPAVVILSHALWQDRYGGDPGVLDRSIEVFGASADIVGVMPPGFELLMPPHAGLASSVDLWVADRIDFVNSPRNNVFIRPVGRLRDGVTLQQAQAQLDRISASLVATQPSKATAGYAIRAEPLHADLTAHVRPVLVSLLGAVTFVLLIACANVSNLLLVRGAGRDRELAVRAALGGSRSRLFRQLLLESGILAAAGALLGLLLAAGGVDLLLALHPADLPRIDAVGIDGQVLGFTVLSATAAALLFGVLPATQASRLQLADALKERGSMSAAGPRAFRTGVVVVEVALSLVLSIGAGLMVRSFAALGRVDPGFDPAGVLTFDVALPGAGYQEEADRAAFNAELAARLAALPNVEAVGGAFPLPLTGEMMNGRYGSEEALTDPQAFRQAAYRVLAPGYFEAMGTRILEGRAFNEADHAGDALVVVIDEKLARALWPEESAVGKRLLVRAITPEAVWADVVGVVEHQRSETLAADGMETVYFTNHYYGTFGGMSWTVRVDGDPTAIAGRVRSEVAAIDPDAPVDNLRPMQALVDEAMGPTRFALTLIGVFAVLALVLASVGLYGVLAYGVRQRTAEIGVRMAFGAETRSILRLVVGQGLALAGAGVLLGVLAAVALTRIMESLLVGVAPTDPVTFLGISGLFVVVAAVACWIPARRATRVDPLVALRAD